MYLRRSLNSCRGLARIALLAATACGTSPTSPHATDASHDPPQQLRYETVRSMLHDQQGNFWFGSWNEGVCRWDGKELTYFTVDDGLTDNQIRAIQQDPRGVVWFEGGVGLSGFDGQRIFTPTDKDYSAPDDWRLGPHDLWFKEDGAVGATEREARPGAYRYDGKILTYLAYPVPDASAPAGGFNGYATTCIAKGRGGRMWFATYNSVFGYDGKTLTVLDEQRLGLDERTGRLHVRCVYEDRRGNLWIGNNGIGVILFDGHTATQFTQAHRLGSMGMHGDRTTPLPGDVTDGSPTLHRVFSIGEDRAGHIWFGTIDHGAWRFDGTTLQNFTAADGLTTKDVMGIYTDRNGDLWLAGHGVFRFDGTSFARVL